MRLSIDERAESPWLASGVRPFNQGYYCYGFSLSGYKLKAFSPFVAVYDSANVLWLESMLRTVTGKKNCVYLFYHSYLFK